MRRWASIDATFYRRQGRKEAASREPSARPQPPLKLSAPERQTVVELMHSQRFVDTSPHTIHATLLDEGHYYCSVRTMYHILAQEGVLKERRNILQHPNHTKPELLTTAPNQLWSWDITKLKGPVKWTYFYL